MSVKSLKRKSEELQKGFEELKKERVKSNSNGLKT
jgi:hypothetical protein